MMKLYRFPCSVPQDFDGRVTIDVSEIAAATTWIYSDVEGDCIVQRNGCRIMLRGGGEMFLKVPETTISGILSLEWGQGIAESGLDS